MLDEASERVQLPRPLLGPALGYKLGQVMHEEHLDDISRIPRHSPFYLGILSTLNQEFIQLQTGSL